MKSAILAALAVALALPAAAQEADAAALYKQRCAMCHGASGQPSATGKKMGAQDLAASHLSASDAAAIIANGKGKMPEYKSKLSAAQIDSLAKYVTSGMK